MNPMIVSMVSRPSFYASQIQMNDNSYYYLQSLIHKNQDLRDNTHYQDHTILQSSSYLIHLYTVVQVSTKSIHILTLNI